MWGCLAKVTIPISKKEKIGPKTIDCIFIGYANNSSAYRFLVHKSDNPDVHVGTIIESRNASVFENVFPCRITQETRSSKRTYEIAIGSNQDQEDKNINELRQSKRSKITKSFGLDFLTFMLKNEPQTYKETVSTHESSLWKKLLIVKLNLYYKIILGSWWIYHKVVNFLDINGYSKER